MLYLLLLAIAFAVIVVTVAVEVVKSLSSEYTSWKSDRKTRKDAKKMCATKLRYVLYLHIADEKNNFQFSLSSFCFFPSSFLFIIVVQCGISVFWFIPVHSYFKDTDFSYELFPNLENTLAL